jgi:hypothetical protein
MENAKMLRDIYLSKRPVVGKQLPLQYSNAANRSRDEPLRSASQYSFYFSQYGSTVGENPALRCAETSGSKPSSGDGLLLARVASLED